MNEIKLLDQDIPALSKKLEHLPTNALTRLGCYHCEWRSSTQCPEFEQIRPNYTMFPEAGICKLRQMWILSLMPTYDAIPTESQWYADFHLAWGGKVALHEHKFYEDLRLKIKEEEAKDKPNQKLIGGWKLDSDRSQRAWLKMWSELEKNHQLAITRDTGTKVEVTVKNALDVLRETTIDAEVIKEVLDDK